MPAERREPFVQPIVCNCFCLPSPHTALFLFPCSRSALLAVNKRWGVLACSLSSSSTHFLFLMANTTNRPLLLAMLSSPSFYYSRKLFRRFKDLTSRWMPIICHSQGSCLHLTWQKVTLNPRGRTTNPKGRIQPAHLLTIARRRETWGLNHSCLWGQSDAFIAHSFSITTPKRMQDPEDSNSLQSRLKERQVENENECGLSCWLQDASMA